MRTMRVDLPAASTAGLLVAGGAEGNPPSAVLPGRIHAEAGVPREVKHPWPIASLRRTNWMQTPGRAHPAGARSCVDDVKKRKVA